MLYGAFRWNGLSLRSARLLSALAGAATVLFLWLFLLKHANIGTANLGALFLALAGFHVLYSRLALAESVLTALLMLTLLFWSLRGNRWCEFAAGFLFTTLFVVKITAFYFIPVFGLLVLVEAMREELRIPSLFFLASGILAAAVLYGAWLIAPHLDGFRYWYLDQLGSSSAGLSPKYLLEVLVFGENVAFRHGFFNKMLLSVPVLFVLTLLVLSGFLFDMGADWRKAIRKRDYAEIVGLCIVIGNAIVIGLGSYKPERRYLPLLLGMAILAACAIQTGRDAVAPETARLPMHPAGRIAVLACLTLPIYVFACWALYSLWGAWTFFDIGARRGLSFNGQTVVLLPLYAVFLYVAHRSRALSSPDRLLPVNAALFLSHILAAWIHFILLYFGITWSAGHAVLFTAAAWAVLYAACRSAGPLMLRSRLPVGLASFVLIQGCLLFYTLASPTYTYRDLGVDAGAIMGHAPLASDITAPFIGQDRTILYGLPKRMNDAGEGGSYYVLSTLKKGNLPADGGRLMILGEEQRLTESAVMIKEYPLFPYGNPEQHNLVLRLLEVRRETRRGMRKRPGAGRRGERNARTGVLGSEPRTEVIKIQWERRTNDESTK